MHTAYAFNRPVPLWLHAWAVFAVLVTAGLLTLGGLVTTFRVGMSDPVWPTEPWYLFVNGWREPRPGFLIEHTHRLAGFTVGIVTAVLTLGLWAYEPRAWLRFLGLAAVLALLVTFRQFHTEMLKQVDDTTSVTWPVPVIGIMLGSLAVAAVAGLVSGGVRLLSVAVLAAVMVQGLLGGLRVKLNALAGTDLAAVHGVFAQVVFSLIVATAVLTAAPRGEPLPPETAPRLRRLGLLLVGLVLLQLVWGAMVRHNPSGVSQRLHFLTAFAVVGAAVWLAVSSAPSPAARSRLGYGPAVLLALIVLQVTLGVDAWMGKFGPGVDPLSHDIRPGQAVLRTAHVLVGTGLLATSAACTLLLFCRPGPADAHPGESA